MKKNNTRSHLIRLCIAAVLMALNVIMSSFSLPVPGGHLYLNDVIICTASIMLDPFYAFAVGGIGAFLGDFFFYPAPMFVSLVVHGLQAVVISCFSHYILKKHRTLSAGIGVTIGAVIMIAGYTFGRIYVYAKPDLAFEAVVANAILKLPYQILQAGVGAVAGMVLCFPLKLLKVYEKTVR